MWLATVVGKTNLIAQDSRSTLCAHAIKGPPGVSNTLESSINSTPRLGSLEAGLALISIMKAFSSLMRDSDLIPDQQTRL